MTVTQNNDAFSIATKFCAAMESANLTEVKSLFSDKIIVWHNTDQTEKTHDLAVSIIEWGFSNLKNIKYNNVRRYAIDGGFLQQHVMTAVQTLNGRNIVLPAAIVCAVQDGQITRLDEYFDAIQAPTNVPVTA